MYLFTPPYLLGVCFLLFCKSGKCSIFLYLFLNNVQIDTVGIPVRNPMCSVVSFFLSLCLKYSYLLGLTDCAHCTIYGGFATCVFATYTLSLPCTFTTYKFATYTCSQPSCFATWIFFATLNKVSISQSFSTKKGRPQQWFIYNFIPMHPRTHLGYIKWVLLENHCVHYRIFHYNLVSPGTRWDLKCESQSKNVSTGLGMRR